MTYRVTEKGYVILDEHGRDWIVQEEFHPNPGTTIEESAQNHIAAILADQERAAQAEADAATQGDRIAALEDAMTALAFGGEV
ncbi:hypothetical protein [Faecalispora jeddahensis]|uniref:hypothetical protein n=1 Tax=Faecalispora jeddahensis TaxID=1414721 RepID=UPI0028ADDA8D|nr:hypothetical protein [Faecalispora jeddahensis]